MNRRTRRTWWWIALFVPVIVVVVATSSYLAGERERILEYGRSSSQIQAQLLAEHAAGTFRQTEFALRGIIPLAPEETCPALRRATLVSPGLITTALLDASGEIRCAVRSLELSGEEINGIATEHDRSMVDFAMGVTTSGDIRISIRLDGPDGSYAGALIGILDQRYLTHRYDEYGTVDMDLIALYGPENSVLALWPESESDLRRKISDHPLLRGIASDALQATGLRTLDTPLVVASVFQLPDYPYRVIVAYRKELFVARRWRQTQLLAVAVTALLGTIVFATARIHSGLEKRMQAEQELSASKIQRSESMRLIAGSLAHHVNNQMMVVLGNVDLLESRLGGALPDYPEALNSIRIAAHRSSRLSERMLAVAGNSVLASLAIDPGKAIVALESRLQAIVGSGTVITIHVEKDVPAVNADPALLETALINLVENAVETVPETGGKIVVTVSRIVWNGREERESDAHGSWHLPVDPPAGTYAGISVSDNGAGMPPETVAKVFDPFFTTRFLGRGLGLPATLGIVRQHGGAVLLETRPGVGTTITILFPIA